jgi:hypothetical protein
MNQNLESIKLQIFIKMITLVNSNYILALDNKITLVYTRFVFGIL